MSHYLDGGSGRTLIAINHRLADAILGGQGQQFAMIDLKEARALKSDAARFIHQCNDPALSAHIMPLKPL